MPRRSYFAEVMADSPIGYWRLNDADQALIVDATGNNHGAGHNTLGGLGQTGALRGDDNKSIRFTPNDYISVAHDSSLNYGDVFTLEAWVKRGANGGSGHGIISKGGSGAGNGAGYIRINSDDTLHLLKATNTDMVGSTRKIRADGHWHHVAATKNGPTVHLYIDGKDVTGSLSNDTCGNTAFDLTIGSDNPSGTPGEFFNGWLDEVAVYTSALSAERVRTHFLAGIAAGLDKAFVVRVSDAAGDPIGVWGDVATLPVYRWPINSGPQAMDLMLPRPWGAAGERGEAGSDSNVNLGNQVTVDVYDAEGETLLYSGSIEEYSIPEPASGVRVTLIPKTSRFQDRVIRGPLTLSDYDPTDMLHYLIDPSGYSGTEGTYLPGISWDAANALVGVSYTQTFEKMRVSQALEIIRRLGGSKWFYRLNPDNSLTFKSWDLKAPADHIIRGPNFSQVKYVRSRSNVKKRVYVYGAEERRDDDGNLIQERIEAVATAPAYDAEADPRDDFYTDARIVDYNTALRVATSRLEFLQDDAIETEIDIPDSSKDALYGYDIDSLKPGDTLKIIDPRLVYRRTKWGAFKWAAEPWAGVWAALVQRPLVIAEVQYGFYTAHVKLTNRPASVIEELLAVGERQLMEGSS